MNPEFGGIDPNELYDGPKPNANGHWGAGLVSVAKEYVDVTPQKASEAQALKVLFDILSTRMLGLIAVVAACVLWGLAVYEPSHDRLYSSAGFSLTVLLPIIVLYLKRG